MHRNAQAGAARSQTGWVGIGGILGRAEGSALDWVRRSCPALQIAPKEFVTSENLPGSDAPAGAAGQGQGQKHLRSLTPTLPSAARR